MVTHVGEHPVFKRRGDDFVVEVPVSFVERLSALRYRYRARGWNGEVEAAGGDAGRQAVQGAGCGSSEGQGASGERGDLIVRARLM